MKQYQVEIKVFSKTILVLVYADTQSEAKGKAMDKVKFIKTENTSFGIKVFFEILNYKMFHLVDTQDVNSALKYVKNKIVVGDAYLHNAYNDNDTLDFLKGILFK